MKTKKIEYKTSYDYSLRKDLEQITGQTNILYEMQRDDNKEYEKRILDKEEVIHRLDALTQALGIKLEEGQDRAIKESRDGRVEVGVNNYFDFVVQKRIKTTNMHTMMNFKIGYEQRHNWGYSKLPAIYVGKISFDTTISYTKNEENKTSSITRKLCDSLFGHNKKA